MRSLLLLSLTLLLSCSSKVLTSPRAAPTTSLTLMTYNVNYGIAGDLDTLEVIARSRAQLVLLQETTPEWEQALRATLSDDYPHMHFAHCCGAGGLAILSAQPFEVLATLDPPDGGWFPSMLIRAHTSLGEVDVLQVHLRPPLSESGSIVSGYLSTPVVREREITHYLDQIAAREMALPKLIVGDFNESDGRAIAHLSTHGMRSVLPEFAPRQHTWRWQTPLGQLQKRLDHVVYDPRTLTPHDARALDSGRSDHLPVLATFVKTQPK